MSICPEPAEALMDRERQVRRNHRIRKPVSWGTVEQAVHSRPERAEELLFHGKAVEQWRSVIAPLFFS